MKTTKGGKVMNPTDAYRKQIRKREIKRNKKERQKVREVGILKKDPEQIKEQIRKLDMSKAEGALDKARKHKKRQLEDTLKMVEKKRKEYEEKRKEQGEATTSVMFSHLPPQRRTAGEDDLKPEDSVYYHPTLNPTGAPPPGKPPMYHSSIGPRVSSDGASSSGAALSSNTESEDSALLAPPPPPPLPPLPDGTNDLSASLPLPPPPPLPPITGLALPHPQFPPPPGFLNHQFKPSTRARMLIYIPSLRPPPALPSKPSSNESETGPPEPNAVMVAPPPPPPLHQQHQSTFPGPAASMTNFQHDGLLPPAMMRFPPPPPPHDMHPPHPGMFGGHLIPRPP
ncbi:hypothetical protein Bca52824_009669 [Brassica carinata]|uniref:Wbp11/ELF5/Saf1 N-terminal domain-containing protein n=1 Tax=Brassica carinata TaxID=52824 RepID=A0A8X7WBC3_BRACI|nr:hypothetical protein Bca52824_009669 [Brassica carinata]